MPTKYIPLSIQTTQNLILFSKYTDNIFFNKEQFLFVDKNISGEGMLDIELAPKPFSVKSKLFGKLIQKFNSAEISVGKNKIIIKEQGKNKTTETFEELEYDVELPTINEISDPDYQTKLNIDDIKWVKKQLEHLKPKNRGTFVNGNPIKTKLFFMKEKRKQILRLENRDNGTWVVDKTIEAECIKKDYQYVIANKLFLELPEENYSIQMSAKDYIAEWFCHKRAIKFTLDLVKQSYAKN
jgi:hypothetical protein